MAVDRSYTLPGVSGADIGLLVLGYTDTEVEVDDTNTRNCVRDWWQAVNGGFNGDIELYGGDEAAKAKKASIQNVVTEAAPSVGLIVVMGNLHSAETNITTIDVIDHFTVVIFDTSKILPAGNIKHLGMVHIYTDASTQGYGGYVVVRKGAVFLPKARPSIIAWKEAHP